VQVADDDRAFLLNAVENLHRQQLSNAERIAAIERLASSGLGVRDISRRTGFNPSTISRWLRINGRPELKGALETGRIDVARAIILVEAPASTLGSLVERASAMSAAELRRQVALLKREESGSVADTGDRRNLTQALRSLRAVRSGCDRALIQNIRRELERLAAESR
jgi:transposase-like protein